ncbi:hypothetical protein HX001_17180 [Empedobacter brevis]|uniref:Uncharacterized protein n=1 Tax=Empedobacter brevis TaxID=247 RepID=A0AAJ1QHL5_9FLAO|nr:hypothetical protein [Empedobacter brevis]MDM1074221.1 hypothetical protein [Empedobacter brevis]
MKNQKQIKVGDKFYATCLMIESARSDKSYLEIEEWIVTKVLPTGFHLKEKVDKVTWGKVSSKNGDFGFLPNTPSFYKKYIAKDESFESNGLYKTKKAASKSSLSLVKQKITELNRIMKRLEKLSKS